MSKRHTLVFSLLLLSLCWISYAGKEYVLADEQGETGPSPKTQHNSSFFDLPADGKKIGVSAQITLDSGKGTLRLLGPEEQVFIETTLTQGKNNHVAQYGPFDKPGRAKLEIALQEAVGEWQAVVVEMPPRSAFYPMLATGPLMFLISLVFFIGWWRWSKTPLRWFWAGAGIWTVGVALKFAFAIAFNERILDFIKLSTDPKNYLAAGSLYTGLLTGVFEIGITLIAAVFWKRMCQEPRRAIAVGVGAGVFEAALLGVVGLLSAVALLSSGSISEQASIPTAYLMASTPALWLCGPVERIIAILCHISSRALVLLSVVTRRRSYFLYGFMIMTAIDTVAGAVHLGKYMGHISMWWVELSIAPFALASLVVLRWCWTAWPSPPQKEPSPETDPIPGE